MWPLTVVWQRLVTSSGGTCDRCGLTFEALQAAVAKLKEVLGPLDFEPKLETIEITQRALIGDPLASNRIWIAGKSLEEWLGARVGSSRCCSVCGDAECRTLEIAGTVFEAVPENLIVKAALLAAAQMVGSTDQRPVEDQNRRSSALTCCVDAALGLERGVALERPLRRPQA